MKNKTRCNLSAALLICTGLGLFHSGGTLVRTVCSGSLLRKDLTGGQEAFVALHSNAGMLGVAPSISMGYFIRARCPPKHNRHVSASFGYSVC